MSTVPGEDAWRDAGLIAPEEDVVSLVEETGGDPSVDRDEYHPRSARPDLDDEANEADVVEQAAVVPGGDDEYA